MANARWSARSARQASRKTARAVGVRWWRRLPVLLVGATVVGATAWGSWWLWQPENLPVRTLRVSGTLRHVSGDELRTTVLPLVRNGFMRMDLEVVRAALERLPWVYSAEVRRDWPDRLLIDIREQQVLARWAEGGLVNPEGGVFRPVEAIAENSLPLLKGPEGTAVMLTAHFIELQRALLPLALTITRIEMDERRAWHVGLDNGVELVLGRSEHPARLERFTRAWPRILEPRTAQIARVDLRYTNGFAVQWRGAAPAARS